MSVKPIDINTLTIEQKIGLMLVARNPIDRKNYEFLRDMAKNHALGAIHLAKRYLTSEFYLKDERDFIAELREICDYPLLICEDMESGFPRGKISVPFQMAIGAADDEALAYEYGKITAVEARKAGYNLIFGPIVDVAENPDACCVGVRSFGSDPKKVAKLANAVIRAYQDMGMIVTAKHFPGFGQSKTDSHIGMVYLNGTKEELIENHLYPYVSAIKEANLSGVMTGHVIMPQIDPEYPCSISKKDIALLRELGFEGIAMTDSFAMVGVRTMYSMEDCYKLSMAAGNDMIMSSYRDSTIDCYNAMLQAYKDGMVSEEQITRSAARVIAAQAKTIKQPVQQELTDTDYRTADEIALRAVAATTDGVDTPALNPAEKYLFIVQEGNWYKDPLTGEMKQEAVGAEVFEEEIRKLFPRSDVIRIPEFPSKPEVEFVLKTTLDYNKLVFALVNRSVSYMGSSDTTKRLLSVIDGVRAKTEAVVQFGCPYAARELGRIPRIVYAFEGKPCQRVAALTLAGQHKPTGKLPVKI